MNISINPLSQYARYGLSLCGIVAGLMLFACGTPPTQEPPKNQEQGLTYHKDTRSIIETKCQHCHQPGNIAPFALTNYTEVFALRAAIREAVKSRRMPPWRADNSCNTYDHNFGLTEEQIKTIVDWVDQGAKEGEASTYTAAKVAPAPTLRKDLELKLPVAYTPPKQGDDYRCFLLDWPHQEDTYITGFQVKPGNKATAHHLIAYVIPPKLIETFQKYDDSDAGPGYSCYGGPTPEGALKDPTTQTQIKWMGAWAPGVETSLYPANTGIKISPGSKVILQMHYSVQSANPQPDQTSIAFQIEKQVQREGFLVPFANPAWLLAQTMKIPAGAEHTEHSFKVDLAARYGKTMKLYHVGLHMHTRGKSANITLERGPQSTEQNACLVRINQWDFNWQGNYELQNPVTLSPGDQLKLTCTWNNTDAAQPIINGQKAPAKDLNWGDGTYDEMCLGIAYIAEAGE